MAVVQNNVKSKKLKCINCGLINYCRILPIKCVACFQQLPHESLIIVKNDDINNINSNSKELFFAQFAETRLETIYNLNENDFDKDFFISNSYKYHIYYPKECQIYCNYNVARKWSSEAQLFFQYPFIKEQVFDDTSTKTHLEAIENTLHIKNLAENEKYLQIEIKMEDKCVKSLLKSLQLIVERYKRVENQSKWRSMKINEKHYIGQQLLMQVNCNCKNRNANDIDYHCSYHYNCIQKTEVKNGLKWEPVLGGERSKFCIVVEWNDKQIIESKLYLIHKILKDEDYGNEEIYGFRIVNKRCIEFESTKHLIEIVGKDIAPLISWMALA